MAKMTDLRSGGKPLERSSEEIRQDIFANMESLSETIDQLGDRMEETFDWRAHMARHPYIVLGAAAGLGFLLSGIFKPSPTPGERIKDAISEAVENMRDEILHKTTPGILIPMVSTIMIKAGIDFLLTKVKENGSAQDANCANSTTA